MRRVSGGGEMHSFVRSAPISFRRLRRWPAIPFEARGTPTRRRKRPSRRSGEDRERGAITRVGSVVSSHFHVFSFHRSHGPDIYVYRGAASHRNGSLGARSIRAVRIRVFARRYSARCSERLRDEEREPTNAAEMVRMKRFTGLRQGKEAVK
jgi:hypothetical protein